MNVRYLVYTILPVRGMTRLTVVLKAAPLILLFVRLEKQL